MARKKKQKSAAADAAAAARAKRKGLSIRTKMLITILPCVIIALVLLTVISGFMSRNIITEQIHSNMSAELLSNSTDINDKLNEVRTTAKDLSSVIGNAYQILDEGTLTGVFTQILSYNEIVSAGGAFIEPNAYVPSEKYFAPYFTKDGSKIIPSDVYTGGKFDYFATDWYQWAIKAEPGSVMITNPLSDSASNVHMLRVVTPIVRADGNKIGVVAVDIYLETFDQLMSTLEFGDQAEFAITSSQGIYIYSANIEKVENEMLITEEPGEFGKAAQSAIKSESGNVAYQAKDDTYHLYYTTIPNEGWKLITRVSDNAMYGEVTQLIEMLIAICVIAIIICVIMIFVQANGMRNAVRRVEIFADELAKGDFSVDKLISKRKDEIGVMAGALNEMYDNNRGMIGKISENSTNVHDSSTKLHDVAQELHAKVVEIHDSMSKVNDAMMSSSAATEEVSASVNEVNASVQKLADETSKTDDHVKDIKSRAVDIQKHSSSAFESAKEIYAVRSEELDAATKKAEVVKEIGNLANSIADIADQINLLSLNASIEAARAGDHGKGFAVVASEINKLAAETGDAVEQIQTTIDAVQDAFGDLSSGANNLLDFVSNQVTPDYETFVDVGRQYGEDAESFATLTADITEMIGFVRESMDQVNAAIASIAESTQDTAANSSEITETVSEVNGMVGDVSAMVKDQTEVAKDLHGIVTQYKL